MNDNNGSHKLTIPTFSPITGVFVEDWSPSYYPPNLENWTTGETKPILCSSHYETCTEVKSVDTLHGRLSRKETCWTSNPCYGVVFSYISHYWEWMEDIICTCRNALANIHLLDAVYASMFLYECNVPMMHYFCESWCPRTNTILIAAGETSISLWDICTQADIFYDEVVPTAAELAGSKDGKQYLPPSCRYMFAALWHITSKSKTSYVTLCHLGYSRGASYGHLSCGFFYLLALCIRSSFEDLGCIHPSVFKPALKLASGRRISLAIPVLTCIYKGLSELFSSFTPGKQVEHFPAHYVYAWLARYF
ncbi:Ribosomal RNA large subunit methyltransferase Cfr [Bienertia sinuspersici]